MPIWLTHCEVGSGLTRVRVSMWPDTVGTGLTAGTVRVRAWAAWPVEAGDAAWAARLEEVCASAMSSAAAPVPSTGIDLCAGVYRKVELLRTGTERDAPGRDIPLAWHAWHGRMASTCPELAPSRYQS